MNLRGLNGADDDADMVFVEKVLADGGDGDDAGESRIQANPYAYYVHGGKTVVIK